MAQAVWSPSHVGPGVSPVGCKNSSNYCALGHEHAMVSFVSFVEFSLVDDGSDMWFVVRRCERCSRWHLLYIDTIVVTVSYDQLVVAG